MSRSVPWSDPKSLLKTETITLCIFVCVQPYSTTLFGVPFPLPTPQGAGIGNSGTSPRPRFEGCARQPSGHEATSANLFRKECQGCNEARKPSCPAPQFTLPRRLSPPSQSAVSNTGYCWLQQYTLLDTACTALTRT